MELVAIGGLWLRDSAFTERKPLLLLAYLALRGRRTRGDVAEAFWPGVDPDLQRKSLSEALRKLRRIGSGVVLEPEPDAIATDLPCDAARLEALAVTAPGDDADATARALAAAYHAPLLDGLENDRRLRLGGALSEWILETRETLHAAVVDAQLRCAERLAQRGDFRAAGALAERIDALPAVPVFPTPDELRRRHAVLLAGNRHGAAATVAQRAHEAYGELGLAPDPAAARAGLDVRRALPPLPHHFLGRDAEGEALLRQLTDPGVPAVQICGHPGVGKSALAAAVATRARSLGAFPGGVAYVALDPLEPGSDEQHATELLASTLGLDPARPDPEALAAAVGSSAQLLVLDDAERIAHAPRIVEALVRHSGATLLLASRARFEIPAIATLLLTGLAYPDPREDGAGAATDQSAAERLFLELAAHHGAHPDAADATGAAAVRRISTAVEGNPLALQLAARWSGSVPLDAIAERLERSWELFVDSPLERAFDDLRQALAEPERQALLRFGAQRGGLGIDDAPALAIVPATLRRLVAFDLIRFDPQRRRYAPHAVVEQALASTLARHPEADAVLDRHALHYLDRLADMTAEDSAVRAAAPRHLGPDTANLEAGWRRAVKRGWWDALAAAAHPLERFADAIGRPRWGSLLLVAASEALGAADPPDARSADRAVLDAARAWLALQIGDYDLGLQLARSARERLGTDDPVQRTALRTALHAAGAIRDDHGAFDDARRLFDAALHLAPEGSPEAAASLINLGVNARYRGAYPASETFLRQALAIHRQRDRVSGQLVATELLATTLRLAGEPLRAIGELDAAAPLLERNDAPARRAKLLLVRAETQLALERLDAAAASLQASRSEGSGNWEVAFRSHLVEADLAAQRGAAARPAAAQALRLACDRRSHPLVTLALIRLVALREPSGEPDRRAASLTGFVHYLAQRPECRAEVRQACEHFLADRRDATAAPPPWTEAALREPRILLERIEGG